MTALLDILSETLPVGAAAWRVIEKQFATWATAHGRPMRDSKSLQKKYKRLYSGPPTGAGGPSPRQVKAREIEQQAVAAGEGLVIHDDEEKDSEEEDDEIAEADALANKRTLYLLLLLLFMGIILGTASRGKQTFSNLVGAVKKDESSTDLSSASPRVPRSSQDRILNAFLQNSQQRQAVEDKRWERYFRSLEMERKERQEREEHERRERREQQQEMFKALIDMCKTLNPPK